MRNQIIGSIWMLAPGTLRSLVKEALEEMNTRIIDYSLEQRIDVKQFEAACNTVNRSCQVLSRGNVDYQE